eukprot:9464988-Pyramimonas_sp.AAC.1
MCLPWAGDTSDTDYVLCWDICDDWSTHHGEDYREQLGYVRCWVLHALDDCHRWTYRLVYWVIDLGVRTLCVATSLSFPWGTLSAGGERNSAWGRWVGSFARFAHGCSWA